MYHLVVITPEKVVFNGPVKSLIAPGSYGYMEILKDHASIISSLKKGKLTITDMDGRKSVQTVTGGLLEVSKNEAMLLVDEIMK